MSNYKVTIRGKLPEDIVKKISALHAEALQKMKIALLSDRKASSLETACDPDDSRQS